jgi:hypothetical protein
VCGKSSQMAGGPSPSHETLPGTRWLVIAIVVVVVLVVLALNPDFQTGIREGLRDAGR